MKYTNITVINDCASPNDKGRQVTRYASLFGISPQFIGIGNYAEIEAAGEIIDTLDSIIGEKGIIAVNSAPRHGKAKKWPNGTPFGFLEIDGNLIVTTVDGYTLSLIKKLDLAKEVNVTDIKTVVYSDSINNELSEEIKQKIINTQFRSFEYLPRLAKWLADGNEIPYEVHSLDSIEDIGHKIWFIDGFGNCKTTILPEEIEFEAGKKLKTVYGEFECYERLRDVPNGELALVVGSSGYQNNRFIELVIQGESAAKKLSISVGDNIFEN